MNRIGYLPGRGYHFDLSDGRGVSCDGNGPKLGQVPLLRRTLIGFMPRPAAEIDFVLGKAFGVPLRMAAELTPALCGIADALNRGDLALAMITTLHLHLPALSEAQALRARRAETLLKAGFNPAEPRDAHGRWTSEGGANIVPAQDILVEPSIGDLPFFRPRPFPLDISPPGINPPILIDPPFGRPKDLLHPPAPGWTWEGQPGSQPGDPNGSWHNRETGESLRDNPDHNPPLGPHYDYRAPGKGRWYRWFPDGRFEPKIGKEL